MTCFRLENGASVRSQVTINQYKRFVKLIEKGYNTAEAFAKATQPTRKETCMKEDVYLTSKLRYCLQGRMKRTGCSFERALRWAQDTGRAWKNEETAKRTLELLKKGYQDV